MNTVAFACFSACLIAAILFCTFTAWGAICLVLQVKAYFQGRKHRQHEKAETALQERLALASERRHYIRTLQAERACM